MTDEDKKEFVADDQGLEGLPGTPQERERAKDFADEKARRSQKAIGDTMRQSATAMELPFTIVGAIVLAGFLGYLADKWLHTSPWLMILGGALGFVSSLVDIARRYRPR